MPQTKHTCRIARMAASLIWRPKPPRRDQLFSGLLVGTAGATSTNPATFSGALHNHKSRLPSLSAEAGEEEEEEEEVQIIANSE